uniref:Alpha-1,3-mannosyl-glycoprotein 2-beta-N-acetylglucosaminyltransferase n=1 Tax=Rhabditophanes sp. KR3021 TaxID=114890 RepID=A0AC35TFZ4_9BILA
MRRSNIKANVVSNESFERIGILVFSATRTAAIKNHLNLLVKYRPDSKQFPIIVSIDGYSEQLTKYVQTFSGEHEQIFSWNHDQNQTLVRNKQNYFLIAHHYKYGLDRIFREYNFDKVIVTEEDLDISSDFFLYFYSMRKVLDNDPSIMCISAWNDNGGKNLINPKETLSFHRTDFFPGLGWMLKRSFWEEMSPIWPEAYWDDFLREPKTRQLRSCVYPEIPRTLHNQAVAGRGSSNGLFRSYLSNIMLSTGNITYHDFDGTNLIKGNYDNSLWNEISNSQQITIDQIANISHLTDNLSYSCIYTDPRDYIKLAKQYGLMPDIRGGGMTRTSYYGIITFFVKNKRFYLIPPNITQESFNQDPHESLYNKDWYGKTLYLEFEETYCKNKRIQLPRPCDPANKIFKHSFLTRYEQKKLDAYKDMIVY